jgi:hypothetical protein
MFADLCRQNLVALAEKFAEAEGVQLSTVSKRAYGNATFFDDLREGRQSISVRKVNDALAWFRENWPKGVEWPELPKLSMGRREQRVA